MQGFQPGKQKPKNYAKGGIVKGPGTGTSDDVPAMVPKDGYIMPADSTQALGFKPGMRPANVSNGEAVLTPEQVQAAGGFQALEAMKAATHTPVPEQGVAEEPKFFFANGGATDEERRKMLEQIPNSAPPGWTGGVGERVTGNDLTRNVSNTVNALAPVSGAAAPVVAGVARGFAGGAKAAAASPVLEKAAAYGAPVLGFGALASAANSDRAPAVPSAAMAPAASPTQAVRQSAIQMPSEPGTPAATASAQNPASQPQALGFAPGVYQHGRGQYSDNPDGMGFKPGFTAKPTEQNDAAAQALADSSMRGFRPAGVEPTAPAASQNLTPADTGQGYGFGLLNSNRIAVRNAAMDVQQLKPGSGKVLANILQQQEDAPKFAMERDRMAQADRESAATRSMRQEELRSDRGFRAGQLANDTARTALDAKKVGSDLEVRGFEVGQAKRMEALRAQYEAATDPKVKADLERRIRTLSGKDDQANRFTVVPGGQEWDATAGVMRNVPARVLNNQTGQFVDGAGGKALPPLKDNTAAMAVVNDVSLSKEQRAAKLRELGYN